MDESVGAEREREIGCHMLPTRKSNRMERCEWDREKLSSGLTDFDVFHDTILRSSDV